MPDPVNNAYTILALSGIGVQPYSARGLTQTLDPIAQAAQVKRTVNGTLIDISLDTAFQKYKSTITATDQLPPAVDGVWPGKTITVDCISELCYVTEGGAPQRTIVPGSSRVEGNFTFYRPRLTMIVLDMSISTDEYGSQVSWSMPLEEV